MATSIALIPGDGIGKEVMPEALKIINRAAELSGLPPFRFTHYDWGCEYYMRHNRMLPEDGLKQLADHDAILLGAVGLPKLVPDHVSLRGLLINIRQGFDQYINYRPIKLLNAVDCPLKGKTEEDIDFVFIRENSEGEYSGIGGIYRQGSAEETALQTAVFTRKGTERVMRYAFEVAQSSGRRKKLTSVTKSNALNYSMVFWDRMFAECAADYPKIETNQYHVDAMAMYLISRPESFDVIVGSNLFGDILTDLASVIQGGIGYAAGANLNPEKKYPSMFEPVHGSAPDIEGRGIANPVAMIWTAQLMLQFLGYTDMSTMVERTIFDVVMKQRDQLTADVGGQRSTSEAGSYIAERLELFTS